MNDLGECCGRTMTSVGIDRDGVHLRSCPSCGAHAWFQGGRRLARSELLTALRRAARPASRPVATRATSRRSPASPAQVDLGDLLKGFTPHGTSS